VLTFQVYTFRPLASGQNVAIKGTTVGYYLFSRREANRREPLPEPWKEVQ
jgi:hypothetical protein